MSDTIFRGKRVKYSYIVSISGAGLVRTKTNNRVNYPQQQEFRKRLMVYSGKEMVLDFIETRHTKTKYLSHLFYALTYQAVDTILL